MSSFIFKTSLKLNKGFKLSTLWYIWHLPPIGGGREPDQPHPPELKFLIWPSSRRDQQKSILGYKLSFLWKFQPDLPTLRGGLNWSGILWHPRYLHSLNLHFGLDMYFWENTLPNFTLVATPVAENMVSSLQPFQDTSILEWIFVGLSYSRAILGISVPGGGAGQAPPHRGEMSDIS